VMCVYVCTYVCVCVCVCVCVRMHACISICNIDIYMNIYNRTQVPGGSKLPESRLVRAKVLVRQICTPPPCRDAPSVV
jgi:hypothetical protein